MISARFAYDLGLILAVDGDLLAIARNVMDGAHKVIQWWVLETRAVRAYT